MEDAQLNKSQARIDLEDGARLRGYIPPKVCGYSAARHAGNINTECGCAVEDKPATLLALNTDKGDAVATGIVGVPALKGQEERSV